MATDCISQVTFEFHDKLKPVVARFDQAQASTDGGAVLLTALDGRLQLTDRLAGCLADHRDPDKILHPLRDLLRQRIFGLACGYEDANDAARLANDPLHKLAVGRDPVTGAALASQPTLWACKINCVTGYHASCREAGGFDDQTRHQNRCAVG